MNITKSPRADFLFITRFVAPNTMCAENLATTNHLSLTSHRYFLELFSSSFVLLRQNESRNHLQALNTKENDFFTSQNDSILLFFNLAF